MSALPSLDLSVVTEDISLSRGLPSQCYTSAEFAIRERDTLLSNTWTCIGLASDVDVRHALPTTLLGLPLVMVRDGEGALRVFHNVCRHRGYQLVPEPCKLRGALRCPYHSWAYGLDGTLNTTPHFGGSGIHEVEGFDKSAHGLNVVRSTEWLGLVFVNLSGDAPSFEDHIAPLQARWEKFVGPGGFDLLRPAATGGRMELTVQSNWKLPVENYCESYHLPWIHPGLNTYSKLEDHYHIMEGDVGAGQGSLAFNFASQEGVSLPTFPDWPEDQKNIAEYVALFPNALVGLQVDHVFVIVLEPISENRTREIVQLLFIGDEATGPDFEEARVRTLEGWREVFAEDVHAVEGMQSGRASPAFDGGTFSPIMDNPTHHFHRWVASRLEA
jgi:choline monooxygenase